MQTLGNSPSQRAATEAIRGSDRVVVLTGPAHVGKSHFVRDHLETVVHPSDLFFTPDGIDGIREALEFSRTAPLSSEKRTLFVDDADLLGHPAQDALLKVCEEPHPGLRTIVVAHDLHAMLPALRSRMRRVVRWGVLDDGEMAAFADTVSAAPSDLLLGLAAGRPGLYLAMMQTAGFEELHKAVTAAASGAPAFTREAPALLKELKGAGPVRDAILQIVRMAARSAPNPVLARRLRRFCSTLHGSPSASAEIHWFRAVNPVSDVT